MKFTKTKFNELLIVETDQFDDERGYLAKYYDEDFYKKNNIKFKLTQVKFVSTKTKATIRGLHMQSKPYEEAKIVRCVKGKIFEVALDLRKNSKTYGKWFGQEFSEDDKKCLYIPKGFAHGYQTLVNNTDVLYLMSGEFSLLHNIGYRWNDPAFGISWPLKPTVMAQKDKNWPLV